MYVAREREKEIEKERKREREKERKREIETERNRERETERKRDRVSLCLSVSLSLFLSFSLSLCLPLSLVTANSPRFLLILHWFHIISPEMHLVCQMEFHSDLPSKSFFHRSETSTITHNRPIDAEDERCCNSCCFLWRVNASNRSIMTPLCWWAIKRIPTETVALPRRLKLKICMSIKVSLGFSWYTMPSGECTLVSFIIYSMSIAIRREIHSVSVYNTSKHLVSSNQLLWTHFRISQMSQAMLYNTDTMLSL